MNNTAMAEKRRLPACGCRGPRHPRGRRRAGAAAATLLLAAAAGLGGAAGARLGGATAATSAALLQLLAGAAPTPSPTPSPTASPTPSPTASPTASPTPSPTGSPTPPSARIPDGMHLGALTRDAWATTAAAANASAHGEAAGAAAWGRPDGLGSLTHAALGTSYSYMYHAQARTHDSDAGGFGGLLSPSLQPPLNVNHPYGTRSNRLNDGHSSNSPFSMSDPSFPYVALATRYALLATRCSLLAARCSLLAAY